ncbi:MAG: L,D-transpeptidase family protein [Candidatus Nomurabacteria bacterium]|nr:L,D-transpeptidase family protein [Candidatus Nomurabacteria bacterium]USN88141.1 MAG: L,D-transpeptidase family protein [Candidatus Nomurabacteria bacterium]
MTDESENRRFYMANYQEDTPNTARGTLIPSLKSSRKKIRKKYLSDLSFLSVLALVLVGGIGVVGVQALASMNVASVTQVSIVNPYTSEVEPLNYGVQLSLSEPSFFAETQDSFIDAALTFLSVDLTTMQIRYFENGVLVENVPIVAKSEEGSWCQTPAGLYKVEEKKTNHFSTIGQVNQPWSIGFESNLYIHGWSTYADKSSVAEDFGGDCIRLNNDDAKRIYDHVKINTPILVHENNLEEHPFLYEAKIPDLKTPRYLIADIDSSTVLAADGLDDVVPIASVTKLMTALIAAEYINLDKNIWVNQPTFVQSLIPRLGDRNRVSMYSLMQLLLVESSNEAAEVIAGELGRDKFMELMNQKAKEIGMTNSYFIDPSGLGAENVSTLSDLLRLSQYIYSNRKFIFELTANQDLPTSYVSGEFGELLNFNQIDGLGNFIGGKVGETNAAGQTSVSLHSLKVKGVTRTIAVIILGSESRNEDVLKLLHYAEERFGS